MNLVLYAISFPIFGCVSEAVELSGAVGCSLGKAEIERVRLSKCLEVQCADVVENTST